jgi:cysteinyl-tRNA synthetase
MDIFIYNTLSRTKEKFEPLTPGRVGLYTCGPTVYNYAHIGNLRTFLFEDLLARMLRFNGYDVTHVMNITDVGHMTSDADAGEDKMETAARRENKDPYEIARFYEEAFIRDLDRLNIVRPTILPRATEHVAEMIALNKRLEEGGFTYTTPEGLYFDTSKDPDYGKLARLDLSSQIVGARDDVNVDTDKRHPADFVLWFANKPGHIMQWESPWGVGYPGWHIECSAMSMKYLGETFDIHCGGIDHIPVHNTNEIAQSESATGKPFVRYWMHAAFLNMGSKKMAKSAGGIITLQTLIDSGYDPLAYRYLCLTAHYRTPLEFAWEWDEAGESGAFRTGHADSLDAAQSALNKLYDRLAQGGDDPLGGDDAFGEAYAEVLALLNDDLALPRVVGTLHHYDSPRLWKAFDPVLGLDLEKNAKARPQAILIPVQTGSTDAAHYEELNRPFGTVRTQTAAVDLFVPGELRTLVEEREAARKARDFARADALRARIAELGWEIVDTPEGPKLKRREPGR